jgi:hypothetical protein
MLIKLIGFGLVVSCFTYFAYAIALETKLVHFHNSIHVSLPYLFYCIKVKQGEGKEILSHSPKIIKKQSFLDPFSR